jgi:dihydroceramidase
LYTEWARQHLSCDLLRLFNCRYWKLLVPLNAQMYVPYRKMLEQVPPGYCDQKIAAFVLKSFFCTDPWQLVDELSMIYTTCLMFFATFSFGKSRAYSTSLGFFLCLLSLSITLYYHYLQDPRFHQNMYALLTAIVLLRSIWIMEVNLRPSIQTDPTGQVERSENAEQIRQNERDAKIVRTMWVMIAYGLSVFLGGFMIWNLDNRYCSTLRRWRRQVGLPWGILLEGHGWWSVVL